MPAASNGFIRELPRNVGTLAAACAELADRLVLSARSDVADELGRAVERSRSLLGELDAVPRMTRPAPVRRSFELLPWLRGRAAAMLSLPDSRALAAVWGWAVAAPLALFSAFGAWYTLRDTDAALSSRVAAVRIVAPTPTPTPATVSAFAGETVVARERAPGSIPADAVVATVRPAMPAAMHAYAVRVSSQPRSVRWVPEPPPRAAVTTLRDPVSACDGRNFFANAICVNNVCAEAASAGARRCVVAVQQRRIDEQRRNPLLMN